MKKFVFNHHEKYKEIPASRMVYEHIDKKALLIDFIEYQETKSPEAYERIGGVIVQLISKIRALPNFKQYTGVYFDKMLDEATLRAVLSIEKWNGNSHPLTWLYRIIYLGFCKMIKQTNAKLKNVNYLCNFSDLNTEKYLENVTNLVSLYPEENLEYAERKRKRK